MASIHYNNSVTSKQKFSDVARELLRLIIEEGEREINLSVDDGDGDVWKYSISIESKLVSEINQLKEN